MKAMKWILTPAATVILLLSACDVPWAPPTPAQILRKPSQSDMKEGHFTLKGHFTSGAFAMDVAGDGTMVLKPKYALSIRMQGSLGAIPIAIQQIQVDGKFYSRAGNEKWTESDARTKLGGNGSTAKDPKLVGEENLSQGKSWHIHATDSDSNQPFDAWIRESDGYLVKYSSSSDTGTLSYDFDKYNTGASVSAPPPAEIKPPPKTATGQVGSAVVLTGVTVTVVSADLDARSGTTYIKPKPGNRYVAVQILYENTGADPYNYNPFDWKLTDSSGFSYDTTYSGIGPELHSGTLARSEKARGYITYEVPASATGLAVKVKSGEDTATFPLAVRVLTTSPGSPLVIGSPVTVGGQGLEPNRAVFLGILQNGTVHPLSDAATAVQSDGTLIYKATVPSDLKPGDAVLVACPDRQSSIGSCAQLSVTLRA
jgi:hypothetical protein